MFLLTLAQLPGEATKTPCVVCPTDMADLAADRLVERFDWNGDRYVALAKDDSLLELMPVSEAQYLELLAEGRMLQQDFSSFITRFF
jgi:hypothetical protein